MTVAEKRKREERFFLLIVLILMATVSLYAISLVSELKFLHIKHYNASPSAPAEAQH